MPDTRYLVAPDPGTLLPARLDRYRNQVGRFVRYGGNGCGLALVVLAFADGSERAFTPSEVREIEVGEVEEVQDVK